VVIDAVRFDSSQPVRITLEEATIRFVTSVVPTAGRTSPLPYVAPGLIDLQVNGYGGQEFCSRELTVEKVWRITEKLWEWGTTRYCPTLTTQPAEVIEHSLKILTAAVRENPAVARSVVGFHLEGPFISPEDGPRGAHPKEHCLRPDWELFCRWQEAAEGRIRMVTLAPELEGAIDFIEKAVHTGVVIALGHTAATADQVRAAAEAGAKLSTHLGNGCSATMHRHRNPIWPQLAEDRLWASFIADGQHLPPEVLKCFLRAKGPARSILVSDLSGQAGQPPGIYRSPFCDVEVLPDGKLVVPGQREYLAGASQPLLRGIVGAKCFAGLDWATAIRLASLNPARLLGLSDDWLAPGNPAELILFDVAEAESPGGVPELKLRQVICGTEARLAS